MSFKDGVMKFVPECPLINTANNDTPIECSFIELYEPRSMKQSAYRSLKQYISSALADGLPKIQKMSQMSQQSQDILLVEDKTNKEKPKALIDLTEEEHVKETEEMANIMTLALESGTENGVLHLFVQAFKKALIQYDQKPVGRLNGESPMTAGIWDSIAAEDQERMAIGYCSFFGIGSLGKMIRGSESASEQPTEVKAL